MVPLNDVCVCTLKQADSREEACDDVSPNRIAVAFPMTLKINMALPFAGSPPIAAFPSGWTPK
jgi:hypothetical protein